MTEPTRLDKLFNWFKNNYVFSIIILLLVGVSYIPKVNDGVQVFLSFFKHADKANIRKPIFDQTDDRFKILVLPFNKQCDYQGTRYDIGDVICKRIEKFNKTDSLNLLTNYLNDSTLIKGFSSKNVDSILKYNNADLIIYGTYSLKQCEGDNADKICYNYITNKNKWDLGKKQSKDGEPMLSISGMAAIRSGYGQEDLDYIIYYISGIISQSNEKFSNAIKIYRKIKDYKSKNEVLFQIGTDYIGLENYELAIENFDLALKINPKDAGIWNNLGYAYQSLKNYPKAKYCFEHAVKIEPTNENYLNNLGVSYGYNKDCEKALESFNKIQIIMRNDPQILFNIAMIYGRMKSYSNEKDCYEKILNINPKNIAALGNLGICFNNLKNYTAATKCLEKAIDINPNYINAWISSGDVYLDLKDTQKAIQCYESALNIDQNNIESLLNLSLIYHGFKSNNKAISLLEKAIKINPKDARIYVSYGIFYLEENEYSKAINFLNQALRFFPNYPPALYNISIVYCKKHNKRESLSYLKKAINYDPALGSEASDDKDFESFSRDKEFIQLVKLASSLPPRCN
jgi:tetratricopeptide (TPR) repeat protein